MSSIDLQYQYFTEFMINLCNSVSIYHYTQMQLAWVLLDLVKETPACPYTWTRSHAQGERERCWNVGVGLMTVATARMLESSAIKHVRLWKVFQFQ